MRQRRITVAEAEATVKNAHTTYPDGKGNICHVATINGRNLKVVVSGADPDFVITVMEQS